MTAYTAGAAVGLGLGVALYLWIALRDMQRATRLSSFFFSDWDLGRGKVGVTVFSSAMSLATVVIAMVQLAVIFGVGIMWAMLTFCAGWFLFQRIGPWLRKRTQRTDTLHTFLGRSFQSRTVTVLASSVTIIGLLGLFATELFAVDLLLQAMGASDALALSGIFLLGAVAIVHAALGGFRSVVRSDWAQSALLIFSIALMAILAFLLWRSNDSPSISWAAHAPTLLPPVGVLIGLFMINVPFPFVDTLAWQRIIASKTEQDFRSGTWYAVFAFALTWTVLVVVGLLVASVLPRGAEPFVAVVANGATFSPEIAFLLAVCLFPGLVSALLSQADAFLNSAGHCFSLDLTSVGRELPDHDVHVRARLHVVMLGVTGLAMTLLLKYLGFRILDLIFAVYAGTLALLPSVLAALLVKDASRLPTLRYAALLSMIGGFLAAWLNGVYSVSAANSDWWLWSTIRAYVPIDVYQSPTYAFSASGILFVLLALPLWYGAIREVKA